MRIAQLLLDYGANVDGSREADREPDGRLRPQFQKTPLAFAVCWKFFVLGALEMVKLLIDKGARLNHGKISCLRLARFSGNREIENLLLQHGAIDNSDPSCSVADYI